MEVCKNDENQGKQGGQEPVQPGTDGAENVAAIQLGNGQQIERSCKQPDPCGAANGMKQQSARGNAGMRQICEKAKQQRRAEDDFGVMRVDKDGNDLGVEKFVERNRLIASISDGELCASDQTRAKSEEKQEASEDKSFCRRPARNARVLHFTDGNRAPIHVAECGSRWIFLGWTSHEGFSAK